MTKLFCCFFRSIACGFVFFVYLCIINTLVMTEGNLQQYMLPIGTMLQGGKYRVVRYMASGGFGHTYEVEHVMLHKRQALKEFFMRGINQREGTTVTVSMEDNRTAFDQMRRKFFKEAQHLASLEEAHIVEVTDCFVENETAYYVMKLIDGQSFSATMKQQGHAFSEAEVRQMLLQILPALDYVHGRGLFHLDLKPGNIMRDADGHCYLIDFGASKQMSAGESQTLSTSTGLCYTPGYAPGEQVNGNTKRIGAWTDFYALGATVYNLLTAVAPPEIDDVKYDGEKAFRFPSTVSSEMRQLVLWLMQPDYPKRPQSVAEIMERLPQTAGQPLPLKAGQPLPQNVKTDVASNIPSVDDEATVVESVVREQTVAREQSVAPVERRRVPAYQKFAGIGILVVCVIGALFLIIGAFSNFLSDSETETATDEHQLLCTVDAPVLKTLIDNMVYVEGGSFEMGTTDINGSDAQDHRVTVSSFWMGKYEVTQEEWEYVMGTNPSEFCFESANPDECFPVEQVSWNDCQEFIRRLNEKTGLTFRLPTEAEWEYAARGGNLSRGYRYSGSDNIDEVAVYLENSNEYTCIVGSKQPNELGLYDMSGNLCEWCQDWYDADYYKSSLITVDPCNTAGGGHRVIRGGSWRVLPVNCTPWRRSSQEPSERRNYIGLRLALSAEM